jgi:hypothetical protein
MRKINLFGLFLNVISGRHKDIEDTKPSTMHFLLENAGTLKHSSKFSCLGYLSETIFIKK